MGKKMRNTFVMIFLALCAMMLGGCSSVPTVTDEAVVNEAKSFSPPAEGKAHVYIYRHGWLARNSNMDLFIDKKFLGESENKHFYLLKLDAGKNYTFETESEFSNNSISLNTESGKTYYIYHYLRMGLLFSQSDFELVTDPDDIEDAQVLIKKSEMSLPHIL